MKNFLKLTSLALLISTSLLSCGKKEINGTLENPAPDGSVDNNKPGGGKYIEFSVVKESEPDWNNIKVGDTVKVKLRMKADLSQNRLNIGMRITQEVDAGSKLDYSVLGGISAPLTTDTLDKELLPFNPIPNYSSNPNIQGFKQGYSLGSVQNNGEVIEVIYTIFYSPRYAMPTTLKFQATLDDTFSETHSQIITFKTTPKN